MLLGVCLLFAAPGCGNSSKAKPATQAAAAEAEEKEEAPAAPVEVKKKPAAPAPLAAPLARRSPKDLTKWELADLQAGLVAHDQRFVPAVLIFSMQNPNGSKQAEELRVLLERTGQMKDDATTPPLPLPPGPAAVPVTAAKPVTPGPAVVPPGGAAAPARTGKLSKRFGGGGRKPPQ